MEIKELKDVDIYSNIFVNSKWEDFTENIPDNSIDLVFTDPPYNVSSETKIFRNYRTSGKSGNVSFDFGEWDYNFNPEGFLEEAKRILRPDGSLIVFMPSQLIGFYYDWMQKNMFPKQLLVWEKLNPLPQFRLLGYRQATEFMYWSTKGKMKKNNPNFIFQKQSEMINIFKFPICQGHERAGHPTQKPLGLCQEIIKRHCREDGMVLDFFSGVGSISIAAYSLNRRYIGIEKDEKYHLTAVRRIKHFQVIKEEFSDEFEQLKFML